jgi:hypothetical protein
MIAEPVAVEAAGPAPEHPHLFGRKRMPTGVYPRPSVESRYWRDVCKHGPDECWSWTGKINKLGYGLLSIDKRWTLAHRYAWTLHNGPIPEGVLCCHRCDNPQCTRPDHLFLGTHADNSRDMAAKGRQGLHKNPERAARGENSGQAKLTGDGVLEIMRRLAIGDRQADIARDFGVTRTTIFRFAHGRGGWKTITAQPHHLDPRVR